jgi:exosortase A-associated hydrolase 2
MSHNHTGKGLPESTHSIISRTWGRNAKIDGLHGHFGGPIATRIFHFGPPDRPLLGALHQTPRLRRRNTAILLCNPFGEEAARAHRLYRVMASHLDLAGYVVLRFDFRGTGDSAGDEADASVAAWITDIEIAAAELERVSGATQLILVGLRLGALLASLAVVRGRLRPRHLVLWDPVVHGQTFLQQLANSHRTFMREEMGDAGWRDNLRVDADGIPEEALGTTINPTLARELVEVDLAATPPSAEQITVICTRMSEAMAGLRTNIAARNVRWIDAPASADWNSDHALNNATLPMDIVQTVVGRIQEVSP